MRLALEGAIPSLRAFAIALCRDPHLADDLVQETLVKAWHSRALFQPDTNLKAWLFTILRNTFLSRYRRLKRERAYVRQSHDTALVQPAAQHAFMDLQDLLDALHKLPEDQRVALLLVGAEGFSYEQAATVTGCAIGTIKSRVNRARSNLAALLDLEEAKADQSKTGPSSMRPPAAVARRSARRG